MPLPTGSKNGKTWKNRLSKMGLKIFGQKVPILYVHYRAIWVGDHKSLLHLHLKMFLKKVFYTWNGPKWRFSILLEKSTFYLSKIPQILFQIRIPRPQEPYSRTWNEYLRYFLWWAMGFSTMKNRIFILDDYVGDHPSLKWEGPIEPSIACLWELQG